MKDFDSVSVLSPLSPCSTASAPLPEMALGDGWFTNTQSYDDPKMRKLLGTFGPAQGLDLKMETEALEVLDNTAQFLQALTAASSADDDGSKIVDGECGAFFQPGNSAEYSVAPLSLEDLVNAGGFLNMDGFVAGASLLDTVLLDGLNAPPTTEVATPPAVPASPSAASDLLSELEAELDEERRLPLSPSYSEESNYGPVRVKKENARKTPSSTTKGGRKPRPTVAQKRARMTQRLEELDKRHDYLVQEIEQATADYNKCKRLIALLFKRQQDQEREGEVPKAL